MASESDSETNLSSDEGLADFDLQDEEMESIVLDHQPPDLSEDIGPTFNNSPIMDPEEFLKLNTQ